MKRLMFFITVILMITLSLSGCKDQKSSLKEKIQGALEERMWEKSGLSEDADYKTYLKMKTAGQLDPDGVYEHAELTETEPEERPGQVHVTFAKNNFIDARYYRDAEHKKPLDLSEDYLNPGDTVYVSEPRVYNLHTNLYRLEAFRVYEILDDGSRGPLLSVEESTDGLILTIPADYEGTELSVVPTGRFEMRELSLNAKYQDAEGQEIPAEGTWYVNDAAVSGSTAMISPVTSYSVRYEYDSTRFELISADPEIFFENGENGTTNGIVIFRDAEALDETKVYSVELREKPEEPEETEEEPEEDVKGWKVTLNDQDEQGVVVFRLDGTAVSGDVVLTGSEKLTMEYTLTDDRYEIVRESENSLGVVLDWIGDIFSKKKIRVTIPVTEILNHTTISRADYVTLKEKGE